MTRSSDFEHHDCNLPTHYKKDHIVNEWIDTGLFIETRRVLKELTMINGRHPKCQLFYRSAASKRIEQERHLLTHPRMIHPFSTFSLYWEFLMFCIYGLLFIVIPVHMAVTVNLPFSATWYLIPSLNLVHAVHMVVLFYCGYYDYDQSRVILKPSLVAFHYLKTFFMFDLLSTLPSVFQIYYFLIMSANPPEYMYYLKFLHLFKIVRCITFCNTFWTIKLYLRIPSYLYMGLGIIFTYLMVWTWSCAIMYCVSHWGGAQEVASFEELIEDFYTGTLVFLVVSYGSDGNLTVSELACHIFFMCVGFVFHLYLIAKVLRIWEKYTSITNKHYNINRQLHEYMRYKVLPVNLRRRISCYMDFKYQKQFYNERKVSNIFSMQLKQEIDMAVFQPYLSKLEIFYDIPEDIQVKILSMLETEIYLPNDIIIRAGHEGSCMYIVLTGTVAIYTASGKEICHLEDGAHFGEIALVIHHKRIATVMAVTACKLFILKRDDFLRILEPYPIVKDQVFKTAAKRYLETSKMDLTGNT